LLARAKWFRRSVIADFPVLPLRRAKPPAHARRAEKKRFWRKWVPRRHHPQGILLRVYYPAIGRPRVRALRSLSAEATCRDRKAAGAAADPELPIERRRYFVARAAC